MMTRYTIVGLTALLAVAGCKTDNPRLAVGDDSCTTSEDCGDNQECVLGECQDVEPDCTTDDDCDEGETCQDGICDGRAAECETASDCDDGEICADGACVPGGPECETDDDCEPGLECINDTCVDTGVECQDNDDCDENANCIDGVCVSEEPECVVDEDCAEGERCLDEVCVEVEDCDSDDDCDDGEVCSEGACLPQICEPGATRCEENAVATCDEDGLAETVDACDEGTVCLLGDAGASCVTQICEPDSVQCADALTISTCDETGTLLSEEACDDGFVCTDGVCEEMACEPFDIGCLDNGTAFACDANGRIEALPCGENQYCQDAQCFDRVCEPDTISCDGGTLVSCDELGAEETRTVCNETPDCLDNEFGCSCTENACRQLVCEPGSRRCIANTSQVCADDGLSWSLPEDCGDGLCVEGTCLDVVCEPGSGLCDGEILSVCNENGTEETVTNCADQGQLCDAERFACVDRACEPDARVCNGNSVFGCNDRGDGFEPIEECQDGERCRGGQCQDTCEPGARRCNGNTLYTCLDDGVNEESEDCGDAAICLVDRCVPQVCEPGAGGCRGSLVTVCNENGTAFEPTDTDCADDGMACDAGECVRINVCPTTLARASSQDAGVGTRTNDLVTLASAGAFLDGRGSTDDTAIDRVDWVQTAGPDGAEISVGDDVRTAEVTGLVENSRYVFQATAVDEEGLEACESDTIEIFTVSDDYMVVHLTWQDPNDPNQQDGQGADVDLHMLKAEEGQWVRNPYAVYYQNREPEWGPEDPRHPFDDTNGRGPEIVMLDNPQDCQFYAVGAHFFREQFGPVTLGWNIFLDGQLAYSSYDTEVEGGDFIEALLIHHSSAEIFEVGTLHDGQPAGQRPTFTDEVIDSELCGIPDDVIPPSCEDHLGDISSIERAAFLQGQDNLSVCADEPDYFEQEAGGQYLLVQLTTNSDALQGVVINANEQVIAAASETGAIRARLPNNGFAYVRTSTQSDAPVIYDIDAVECEEDEFEGNHTQNDSIEVITGMEPNLSICAHSHPDWFHTDLEIGDTFTFTSRHNVNAANVQIVMFGPNGVVDEARGNGAEKTISSGQVTVPGRYRVQALVAGSLDIGDYGIQVQIDRARVGIDLSPVDLTWEPQTLERGDTFSLDATVANFGARGATFSNARIYLQNVNDEVDLDFPEQAPFPPQTVRTDTFDVEVPEDIDPGGYELCFEVDEGGDIPEVNEDNNVWCESVQVSACLDPYEPNGTAQQAVASDADWIAAAEDEIELDLCPQGDQDWFYADVGGEHRFCVERQDNQTFYALRAVVGNRNIDRVGGNPCIDLALDNQTRVFFRVTSFNGGDRAAYVVTYE